MLSLRLRRVLLCLGGLGIFSILAVSFRQRATSPLQGVSKWIHEGGHVESQPDPKQDSHPVVELIDKANEYFDQTLKKETFDLAAAARRYRERRGRHPPPGFDKWYKYAKESNAVIVEEFWDQIYHDISPLWALDPREMHRDVVAQPRLFKMRNGSVSHESDHFWMDIWKDLFQSVAKDLPDMDLAVNSMDEPRMLVPWEKMAEYIQIERKSRAFLPVTRVSANYSAFLGPDEGLKEEFPWDRSYHVWPRHTHPCPPDSAARIGSVLENYSFAPHLSTEHMAPHIYKGYVSNYTLSTSICHQPDLQGLHGYFVEPISVSTTPKLFPMFGSSKLSVNSEILIPATMYYKGDERFTSTAAPVPWEEKSDSLFWRGLASGGRNKIDNWKCFHRHRLVSMLNGTQALSMPSSSGFIDIQALPLELWNLQSWANSSIPRNEAMGEWLNGFVDVGLNDLACFPKEEHFRCSYTNYLFTPLEGVSLPSQHKHKYLVDVDGNSFSGRYLDFLQSGSLPIKATLFREWHDSRLVAWKHFVPLDNRFMDIYGIMEFFLGFGFDKEGRRTGGRDHLAKQIAEDGAKWAAKVLRREDMRVYVYRVLLEYARVMDLKRDELGWIDDMI